MNGSRSYLKPALISGAVFGVASGIPFVNCLNLFCCALAIGGGFLAAYLWQQGAPPLPQPPYGQAAVLGLLTGVIGALVALLVSLPIQLLGFSAAGGLEQLQEQMADADVPPEVQNLLSTALAGGGVLIGFLFNLVLFSLFAMVGALIGAAVLNRQR